MGKSFTNRLLDPLDIFGNEKRRVAREDKLAAEAKADAKEASAEAELDKRRAAAEERGRIASSRVLAKRSAARAHVSRNQTQVGRAGVGLGTTTRTD